MSPCCTTSPARITASRSATVNASSWSWVTISAVVPLVGEDPAQVAGQPLAQPGVERGERLVEEQQPRAHGQAARQGDALPLAAGQRGRQPVGVPLQTDQLEQLGDPRVDARRRRRSRSA